MKFPPLLLFAEATPTRVDVGQMTYTRYLSVITYLIDSKQFAQSGELFTWV